MRLNACRMPITVLSDEELALVAFKLADCWRSVCDLASCSRRTSSVLRSKQEVWHKAAVRYLGGVEQMKAEAMQLLRNQREALESRGRR